MYQNIVALFCYKIFMLMVIAVFELLIHIGIYPSIIFALSYIIMVPNQKLASQQWYHERACYWLRG